MTSIISWYDFDYSHTVQHDVSHIVQQYDHDQYHIISIISWYDFDYSHIVQQYDHDQYHII
jgi:hypothetical protein